MDVIQDSPNAVNILVWANQESKSQGSFITHFCLRSVLESGDLRLILKSVDFELFHSFPSYLEAIEDILNPMEEYLRKECGRRIKLVLKNKILKSFHIESIISLALFICLHSQKKNQFISRIMQQSEEVKQTLMTRIEEIISETESILQMKDILLRIEELQLEADSLRKDYNECQKRQESQVGNMRQLQNELGKSQKQLKEFKKQKQNALQTLKLSSLDEYLESFQQLQAQNAIITQYAQEMEESNEMYQLNEQELKKCIQNQMTVISDLNDSITSLKEKYNVMKLQSIPTIAFDETLETSRSFGLELMSSSRDNFLDISHIQNKDKAAKMPDSMEWIEEEDKVSADEEELKVQLQQLRKYNSDLISKLDGVYQTVQSLTTEASGMREKNRRLAKQRNFYKNQVEKIKELHKRFQDNYFGIV